MRRSSLFLLFLAVVPGLAKAQVPDRTRDFYLGVAGVVETSANSQVPGYSMGSGFEAVGGYQFDPTQAVQLKVGNFYYYGPYSSSIYRLRPLAQMKLSLDLKDYFQPYLFLGPGLDLEVDYIPYQVTSTLAFVLSAGAGVQFDLGAVFLYGEAEYDSLFQNGTPVDNPAVQSIPLQIGFLCPL